MLQITWLLLAALILAGAVGARRKAALHRLALGALSALFVGAGAAVNAAYLLTGRSYTHFADGSPYPFVRDTWSSVVVPHETFFISLLVLFEATVGVLVLVDGTPRRVGLVLITAFHVALLAFGWWFLAWSLPMLTALVLLLRAERSGPGVVSPAPSSSRSAGRRATARR